MHLRLRFLNFLLVFIYFNFSMIFSLFFVQTILSFHYNFWKNMLFEDFVSKNFFLCWKGLLFTLGTIVNFVAIRQFKVCLSVSQNICLGYKSRTNWSIIRKFGYVFAVSSLSLCTKNCDYMLDTFYRDISKSWIFVLIHAFFR